MTVRSYVSGHPVHWWGYPQGGGDWIYSDNGEPVDEKNPRPCKRCGELPTKEGFDACTGFVPGAESVCCGHGVTEPIMIMKFKGVEMKANQKLVDEAIEQIKKDIEQGDVTSLDELLLNVDEKLLKEFIGEGD